MAGGLPCVGPALAESLKARAHAALGDRDEVAAALSAAEAALGRLDPAQRIGSAFGDSESQLRFHAGNAWTHVRDTGRAREEHTRALELYPDGDHTDRALIGLDQAMCLAVDGDTGEAAVHATVTMTRLPVEHRSALIVNRAREVADTVPMAQAVSEVRVLREILVLSADG